MNDAAAFASQKGMPNWQGATRPPTSAKASRIVERRGRPATELRPRAEEIVRSGEIRGRSARPPDPLSAISQHRLDPRFNFTEVIGVLWNR